MARRRAGRGARKDNGVAAKHFDGGPAPAEKALAAQSGAVPEVATDVAEPIEAVATCGEREEASTVSTRTSTSSGSKDDPGGEPERPCGASASSASGERDAAPDATSAAGSGSASEPLPPLPCSPPLACSPAPCAVEKRAAPFSPAETLLILDWDDTCLPSSWVAHHNLRLDMPVLPELQVALDQLAPKIRHFLQLCKSRGDVLLITNAERGWVERSCEKFMPSVVPELVGARVFSARSAFEQDGVFAPLEWKRQAFTAAIRDAHARSPLRNVLSLGDSPHERDALFTARDALLRSPDAPRWHSKSVKFMERPDACQLLREHILVLQFFDQVLDHDGDLDLCIKCC